MTAHRGFSLLEVTIAALILGLSLTGLQMAFGRSLQVMNAATYLEAAQEVMDFGDMAYPLSEVTDEKDIDVDWQTAEELFDLISERKVELTEAQKAKYKGYYWKREALNDKDQDSIDRLGGLYIVKVTVRWGGDHFGKKNQQTESYVTLWRKDEAK